MMNRVLVVACHPDDEVLGCGGAIQWHIDQGDEVSVCIVTIASNPEWDNEYREQKDIEQEMVDKCLGITKRFNLGISVLEMNNIARGRFNASIHTFISDFNPDIIYTHWHKDLNEQHRLVAQAVIAGTRLPSRCTVLMFENESTRFSLSTFRPNYYVNIINYIDKKCKAMSYYDSEQKDPPHPRSLEGMWNHSKYRGDDVGLPHAEAFYLVRCVI